MVSNFERILAEIRKEAGRIAPTYQLDPESVVNLVMDIVDLEDRNRVRADHRIKSKIRRMIENAAPVDVAEGG